jgi:hypothetical protein
LAPAEQQLLRWLFLEARDTREICRRLQVDRAHLCGLLLRARYRLREELAASSDRSMP